LIARQNFDLYFINYKINIRLRVNMITSRPFTYSPDWILKLYVFTAGVISLVSVLATATEM